MYQAEFNLDAPEIRHGRKRKGKDVRAINECIECGEDVDEIAEPENAIRCANIGCETRWVK